MSKKQTSGGAHIKAKGDAGEKFIHDLTNKYYFPFFCFPNPRIAGGEEICDLLLVCGSYAIIWQIKNINKKSDGLFKKREVEKSIRQCRGARKTLENGGVVSLKAADGNLYRFDPTKIITWHQIAIFVGDEPDFIGFYDDTKDIGVHTFTHSFATDALNYLDTIPDLSEYLTAKEVMLHKEKIGITLMGTENDLLAMFLKNGRTFGEFGKRAKKIDMAILDFEGMWNEFKTSDAYKYKMNADKISKGWDFLIHAAAEQMNKGADRNMSRELVEILSSHNRLERRMLSKAFGDGWTKATSMPPNKLYRRLSPTDINGTKVMFLFQWLGDKSKQSDDKRNVLLNNTALVARKEYPEYKIILGITSEQTLLPDSPITFMLQRLDDDVWTPEFQRQVKDMQDKTGALTNLSKNHTTSYEFDDDDPN